LVAGAAWAIASAAAFSASSAAAKFLGVRLPASELALFRAAVALVLVAAVFREALAWRRARHAGWFVVRCAAGALALLSFMYAITALPIALATLIFVTRVLMLPPTARLLLGEPMDPRILTAVMVGFAGIVVVLWPTLVVKGEIVGALAALTAAVASAVSQTAVRRLAPDNPESLMVAIYSVACVVALAPLAATQWVTPPLGDLPVLVALGAAAAISQYTAVTAFRRAPAAFLAPFDFLAVPFSALIGLALFGDVLGPGDLVGGALVLGASAYVVTFGARADRQRFAEAKG
jgi:drug/metabolite transporter (DMT)-like permease